MDGISAMDTGNNGQMLSMNTEAVAEVKVLTSAYQAEYGRSSGIQVLSMTKGGTNRFRGSLYDIERHSQWNKNSWTNIQNGTPKAKSDQRDWGYSIGGPIGKPGGDNKLFFFYSHEFRPRTSGNVEYLFRLPTALERQGNFSQSRDNLGNLYPYVRDCTTGLPCSASNTAGCFQYQGVLGWIPPDRLYQPGMNLLNMFPITPNVEQTAGMNYNTKIKSPTLKTLEYQPAVRVDYQITSALRVAFKFNAHNRNSGIRPTFGVVGASNDLQLPDRGSEQLPGQPDALDHHVLGVGQLQPRVEDVPGGALGADAELLCLGGHGAAVEPLHRQARRDSRHLHHQPGRQSGLLDGRRAGQDDGAVLCERQDRAAAVDDVWHPVGELAGHPPVSRVAQRQHRRGTSRAA